MYQIPIVFKPLESSDDLIQHFRLRHELYLAAKYRQQPNVDGLDIDPYDLRSLHIGALALTPEGVRQVGGVRMIFGAGLSRTSQAVEMLLNSALSAELQALPRASSGLPSAGAFDFSPVFKRFDVKPDEAVEFSRTFCLPEARRSRIGLGLVYGICTLGQLAGVKHGIGSCEAAVAPFYQASGVLVHDELGEFYYPEVDKVATALSVPLQPLPPPIMAVSRAVTAQFVRHGVWCSCVMHEQPQLEACNCLNQYNALRSRPPVVVAQELVHAGGKN